LDADTIYDANGVPGCSTGFFDDLAGFQQHHSYHWQAVRFKNI
jgi:hypothetical protein